MREILFRGKQITDKVWVVGGIDTVTDGKPYICKRARYRPDTRDWDTAEYYEKNPHYTRACIEVIPETIGQFTGLTDKNGEKIFEGDVVKVRQERCDGIGVIGYENGSFMIYVTYGNIYERTLFDYWYNDWGLEVIGNKYDNPELLEVKS